MYAHCMEGTGISYSLGKEKKKKKKKKSYNQNTGFLYLSNGFKQETKKLCTGRFLYFVVRGGTEAHLE